MFNVNYGKTVKNEEKSDEQSKGRYYDMAGVSTGRFPQHMMNHARHINPFITEDDIDKLELINKFDILVKTKDGEVHIYDAMDRKKRFVKYSEPLTEEEFIKEFGYGLRKALDRYYKTETELADYLNIHRTTVNRYVNGLYLPNAYILDKILKFFKIDINELLIVPYVVDKYILGLDV